MSIDASLKFMVIFAAGPVVGAAWSRSPFFRCRRCRWLRAGWPTAARRRSAAPTAGRRPTRWRPSRPRPGRGDGGLAATKFAWSGDRCSRNVAFRAVAAWCTAGPPRRRRHLARAPVRPPTQTMFPEALGDPRGASCATRELSVPVRGPSTAAELFPAAAPGDRRLPPGAYPVVAAAHKPPGPDRRVNLSCPPGRITSPSARRVACASVRAGRRRRRPELPELPELVELPEPPEDGRRLWRSTRRPP